MEGQEHPGGCASWFTYMGNLIVEHDLAKLVWMSLPVSRSVAGQAMI